MLTDFLLARIAEDEARATLVHEGGADPTFAMTVWPHDGDEIPVVVPALTSARVLADCEAKRRIVEDAPARVAPDRRSQWERTLRTLATIYVDHPDYSEEWKP